MQHKFVIDIHGDLRAVYSDDLRDMNLGPMKVERASNVEFNEPAQLWEAWTPLGELIASGPDRDKVLQDEVRIIQSRL